MSRDFIDLVGSRTVEPFVTAIADSFTGVTAFPAPSIEGIGSGAGRARFVEGVGEQTPDIVMLSRPMRPDEFDAGVQNGVTDLIEILLGYTTDEAGTTTPLYLYVKQAHLGVIPGLEEFIALAVSDGIAGPGGLLRNDLDLLVNPALAQMQAEVAAETTIVRGDLLTEVVSAFGTDAGETIAGASADDEILGFGGDDVLDGGPGGSDSIDGGDGVDIARWDGALSDYILQLGSLSVIDKGDSGETDVVENVELLEFGDGFSFGADGAVDLRAIEGVANISADELMTLVEMYIAYFDRAPDSLGLFYWGARLADGMTLGEIAASFFEQPESLATFPDVNDNAALVDAAYQNLLERDAEPEGRDYWIGELASGNVSRAEFMLAIINGAKADTGSPEDASVIADKGKIGIDFAAISGLNDSAEAATVMSNYDRDDAPASLDRIEAQIEGYLANATAPDSEQIVVQLTGVIDDPFAT